MLGTAESVEDIAAFTVQTVVESSGVKRTTTDAIRSFLAEYIGEQSLLGVFRLRLDKLRKDAPDISRGYLPFLRRIYEGAKSDYRGLMLILDEINGMAGKPSFGAFLKNLVDENALSDDPLPLVLILCGTDERHREIIAHHRPVERIFEVAHIDVMNKEEMREFFQLAFGQVDMTVEEEAMELLCLYSAGFPKLMHLVGDAAFWIASGSVVDQDVAIRSILAAAEDVGRKFVDQQVYRALRSKHYRSILDKLAKSQLDLVFKKSDMEHGLNEEERKKFNNFLQRMKSLNVLAPGDERGEYAFRDRLTLLYFRMQTLQKQR
jgi:hypothetical protein